MIKIELKKGGEDWYIRREMANLKPE